MIGESFRVSNTGEFSVLVFFERVIMTASSEKPSFLFTAKVFRHDVCVKKHYCELTMITIIIIIKKQSYYYKYNYTKSIYNNVKHRAFLVKLRTFLVKYFTDIKKIYE